jgi:multiple sugar transport system substrate-binding protein
MKKMLVIGAVTAAALSLLFCILYFNTSKSTGSVNKPTTVRIWLKERHISDVMNLLVNRYNETGAEKDGIMIEYKDFGDEYETVFATAYATNNQAEIMSFPSSYSVKQLIDNSWIKMIESIEGGKQFLSEYNDLSIARYNDKAYAVKMSVTTVKLIYNKELFQTNNIVDKNGNPKFPKTWEEIVEYARKITEGGNGEVYGIVFPMRNSEYFWDLNLIKAFEPAVGFYYDDDNAVYNFSIYEKAFNNYLLKIKDDKSFYPNPLWIDNDNACKLFAEGKVGMKISSFYDISVFNNMYGTDFDWGVAELPMFEDMRYKKISYAYEPVGFAYLTNAVSKMKNEKNAISAYSWLFGNDVKSALYNNGKYLTIEEEITKYSPVPEFKGWHEFSQFNAIRPLSAKDYDIIDDQDYTKENIFDRIWTENNKEYTGTLLKQMDDAWNKALK